MIKPMLYVATTPDELELPIAVADTGRELARILGTTPDVIYTYISLSRKGIKRGTRKKCSYYIRLVPEKESEEQDDQCRDK